HGVSPPRRRRAAASAAAGDGLGSGPALGSARARARLETRGHRRAAGAPRVATGGGFVLGGRRRSRGAALPRRQAIHPRSGCGADYRGVPRGAAMKVVVVAEYYPRRRDPVLGIWAHRQALAARDAGADVKVLVLERPIPPATSLRRPWRLPGALRGIARQPQSDTLDGIDVRYVRFTAGPRERSYASWHENAAGPLGKALAQLHAEW